ncbi:unnamed protein product [Colias eurytheme]|nr:unnamed protein product [Colias eurytheme]
MTRTIDTERRALRLARSQPHTSEQTPPIHTMTLRNDVMLDGKALTSRCWRRTVVLAVQLALQFSVQLA